MVAGCPAKWAVVTHRFRNQVGKHGQDIEEA
jgi:hypothetical protein